MKGLIDKTKWCLLWYQPWICPLLVNTVWMSEEYSLLYITIIPQAHTENEKIDIKIRY